MVLRLERHESQRVCLYPSSKGQQFLSREWPNRSAYRSDGTGIFLTQAVDMAKYLLQGLSEALAHNSYLFSSEELSHW